jgi:hypothetical protein
MELVMLPLWAKRPLTRPRNALSPASLSVVGNSKTSLHLPNTNPNLSCRTFPIDHSSFFFALAFSKMAPGKRRKITEATTASARLPQSQRGIQAFGRISKGQNAVAGAAKASTAKDSIVIASPPADASSPCTPSKKRKLGQDEPERAQLASGQSLSKLTTSVASLLVKKGLIARTSRQKENSNQLVQTPTKSARGHLERLNLEPLSSTITPRRFSSPSLDTNDTPPTSPCAPAGPDRKNGGEGEDAELPAELQGIISLHASFLTALSLHYAHHGMSTPVDLKVLMASMERIWGKRKVTVEDIQRLVGLMNHPEEEGDGFTCGFKLKNFGLRKIMLENSTATTQKGFVSKPFDELVLRDDFETSVCRFWKTRRAINEGKPGPSEFLNTLPKASITTCPYAILSASKAQRKLEDLKVGAIKAQEKRMTTSAIAIKKDINGVNERGKGLLERLKAKEMHQAKLPPPLSKEQLLRRSALQRVEDIAGVLSMLKTSASAKSSSGSSSSDVQLSEKSSFGLSSLVQRIKDSAKTPISREEVEMCLQLLAEELAVEWVRSLSIGKMRCVVLYHRENPGFDMLKKRVSEALRTV